MRISFLKVQNYRSIQSLEVKIPQICVLVGPNNSGKSNILRAIKRVLEKNWLTVDSFKEEDVYGRQSAEDIQISVRLDPPVLYEKNRHQVEIHGLGYRWSRYKIGPHKGNRRLEHIIQDRNAEPPRMPEKPLKAGVKPNMVPMFEVPSEVQGQIPLIYIGTNRSLKEHLPGAKNSLLGQLLSGIDEELRSGVEKLTVRDHEGNDLEDTRLNHFNALMGRAMDALRNDNFKALETTIKKHVLEHLGMDPDADVEKLDFHFEPFDTMDFFKMLDLRVKDESGFSISASELGEGLQNAMVLAILRAFESTQKKGAILLIEEPEMFLHPQMQRSLYKTLREIGKNNQVIYTTHSPHFVSIPEFDEVLIVRKGPNGTEVAVSDLTLDDPRREKFRKELDPERNEFFFARRVLFVEGDTEKLALPEFAAKRNLDLDKAGVTIVEVGGKKSLKGLAEVAISFGIPTGILFDRDSRDFKKERDKEEACNQGLLDLAPDGSPHAAWMMEKDYESIVRAAAGEELYLTLCGDYSTPSKPIKGRLIAADSRTPIPPMIEEVLTWATAAG